MLQIIDALWPHVEEQVKDAEVRQETMFLTVDLIVGLGREVGIRQRMLGVDHLTEIYQRSGGVDK